VALGAPAASPSPTLSPQASPAVEAQALSRTGGSEPMIAIAVGLSLLIVGAALRRGQAEES
jgi:hypothetical protein